MGTALLVTEAPLPLPVRSDVLLTLTSSMNLAPEAMEREFGGPAASTEAFVRGLSAGPPTGSGALTLIPLQATAPSGAPVVARLWEAPANQSADSGGMSQPVDNATDGMRLGLLGQVLEGPETQDRTLERSQLMPGRSTSNATAFCCEEKFTAVAGKLLAATPHLLTLGARERLMAGLNSDLDRVTPQAAALRSWSSTALEGTQRAVWLDIQTRLVAGLVSSPFHAYLDLVRAHSVDREAQLATMTWPEQTCGFLVGRGNQLVAIEVFGSTQQFAAADSRNLITSYLESASTWTAAADAEAVSAGFQAFQTAATVERSTYLTDSGGGISLRIGAAGFRGSALCLGGRLVHMLVLPR